MDNFYENAGRKIQFVAKAIFAVFSIISIILAIMLFIQASKSPMLEGTGTLLGFIFLIGGPLLSWIASLMIYGFGDLVINSHRIADKLSSESAQAGQSAEFGAATYGTCQICGEKQIPVMKCKVLSGEDVVYKKVCVNCKETFGIKN